MREACGENILRLMVSGKKIFASSREGGEMQRRISAFQSISE